MEDQRRRSPSQARSKGGEGDMIECSGKYWGSCTAGMIADCVALCCCPCAVLNCLALAFVKAPWMVGRRCLGFGRKKRKKKNKNKKKRVEEDDVVLERNHREQAITRIAWVEESMLEIVSGEMAFEADKVWKEMYDEIGHFGFFHRNSNSN